MALLDFLQFDTPPEQEVAGLAESMRVPEQDPYALYEKLFEMFQPQFSSPSEDWQKLARRRAIGALGAGILSGGDLLSGLGRGAENYQKTLYGMEQDQQRRLDLRAREDALSRYRAAQASGAFRPEDEPQAPYDPQLDPQVLRREYLIREGLMADPSAPRREDSGYIPKSEEEWSDISRKLALQAQHATPRIMETGQGGGEMARVNPRTGSVETLEGITKAEKKPRASSTIKDAEARAAFYLEDQLTEEQAYKVQHSGIPPGQVYLSIARDRIARNTGQSPNQVTVQDIMDYFDKLEARNTGVGMSTQELEDSYNAGN